MKYMLDTNICIYAMKKKSHLLMQNLLSKEPSDICISSITYAELMHGVAKSSYPERNFLALTLFLSQITILDYSSAAAEKYGFLRSDLESKGTPIGPMDLLIASHALAEGLILVTNNTREFLRVNGLTVEDWTASN